MPLSDPIPSVTSLAFIVTMTSTACTLRRSVESSDYAVRAKPSVALINILQGEDRQAKIVSFDGVPFAAFASRYAQSGHYRIPIHPGPHEVRVVVPGPCTYYDGLPGPGPSLSTMRFIAKADTQYEISTQSFPSQILTVTMVHVLELQETPNQVRIVEEVTSTERDPSSCVNGRGRVP